MRTRRWLSTLYLLNATLLLTHEIDSAFWHEWDMFGLPGGIQLFVAIHVPLVALVLAGYRAVVLGTRAAGGFSLMLAGFGFAAVAIHGGFLAAGRPEFAVPVSLAVLGLTLVVSIAQVVSVFRA